jgi:hypothetical protein
MYVRYQDTVLCNGIDFSLLSTLSRQFCIGLYEIKEEVSEEEDKRLPRTKDTVSDLKPDINAEEVAVWGGVTPLPPCTQS